MQDKIQACLIARQAFSIYEYIDIVYNVITNLKRR